MHPRVFLPLLRQILTSNPRHLVTAFLTVYILGFLVAYTYILLTPVNFVGDLPGSGEASLSLSGALETEVAVTEALVPALVEAAIKVAPNLFPSFSEGEYRITSLLVFRDLGFTLVSLFRQKCQPLCRNPIQVVLQTRLRLEPRVF